MEIKSKPKYDNFNYSKMRKEINALCSTSILNCSEKRVAIDIGGHLGVASEFLSHCFEKVHTFEPLWYEHTIINLEHLTNVEVHPIGLGEKEKTEKIWIAEHNIGGSSMVPHPLRERKWMHKAKHKEVKVVPLDSFNFTNVDFMKIDVESYEYEVLKGAKNTIETNRPIIGIELLQSYQSNYKEIIKYIESFGYQPIEKLGEDVIFKPIK